MEYFEHLATVAYYKSLDQTFLTVMMFHPSVEFRFKIRERKNREIKTHTKRERERKKKRKYRKNGHEHIFKTIDCTTEKRVNVRKRIKNIKFNKKNRLKHKFKFKFKSSELNLI